MILKNDFYNILEKQNTDSGINFTVNFNVEHFIYKSHFPGNPITPGVCIAQIVKELTEELTRVDLFLKIAKNIKFTQIINPLQHPKVTFALNNPQKFDNGFKVNAIVKNENETFAKLILQFTKKRA